MQINDKSEKKKKKDATFSAWSTSNINRKNLLRIQTKGSCKSNKKSNKFITKTCCIIKRGMIY